MTVLNGIEPHRRVATRALQAAAAGRLGVMRFTREQYHQMLESGELAEPAGVELLYGMIVYKDRSVLGEDPMGQSPLHATLVAVLAALVLRINDSKRHLRIQAPIAAAEDHEPEPDGAIIRGVTRDYLDQLPGPGDVHCVIEAAHSSLERDTEDKLPIYAKMGVAQYIIVNLRNNTLEAHANPDPAARTYRDKHTFVAGQTIELNLGDGESLAIDARELLP